jgi:hypothetical protein
LTKRVDNKFELFGHYFIRRPRPEFLHKKMTEEGRRGNFSLVSGLPKDSTFFRLLGAIINHSAKFWARPRCKKHLVS